MSQRDERVRPYAPGHGLSPERECEPPRGLSSALAIYCRALSTDPFQVAGWSSGRYPTNAKTPRRKETGREWATQGSRERVSHTEGPATAESLTWEHAQRASGRSSEAAMGGVEGRGGEQTSYSS